MTRTIEQLDFLVWAANNPQPEAPIAIAPKPMPINEAEPPESLEAIAPAETPRPFATGDIVVISQLNSDEFFAAGSVVSYTPLGMVQVDIGIPGQLYTCSEDRVRRYEGVVCSWRLGAAASCDRPDCEPKTKAEPFQCSVCGQGARPWWWHIGDMALKPVKPRWPNAMWYPAGYDPNFREGPLVGE